MDSKHHPAPVTITAELTDAEALALAQFHKRLTWSDFRTNAMSEAEAYLMRDASDKIRTALVDQGYAPR
jgi:hypothetical protein